MLDSASTATKSASRVVFWVATVLASVAAVRLAAGKNGDWPFFVQMGKAFANFDGLHVYARHPNVQTGPISLVVTRLLSWGPLDSVAVYGSVFAVLGCVTSGALDSARRHLNPVAAHRLDLKAVVAAAALMLWWSYLTAWGHLDDALVLTMAALAIRYVIKDRRPPAALVLGIALAVKPWAIFLIPLTLDRHAAGARRVLHPALSLLVGGVFWLPFFIADPRTLHGLTPAVNLAPDSVLRLFGVDGADLSSTLRISQLVLATVVVSISVLRGRVAAAVLAGFAMRLMLDPATWAYYTPGLILGAVAWDLCTSKSRIPLATLVASALLAPVWVVGETDTRAGLRLLACVAGVAIAVLPPGVVRVPRSQRATPQQALEMSPV